MAKLLWMQHLAKVDLVSPILLQDFYLMTEQFWRAVFTTQMIDLVRISGDSETLSRLWYVNRILISAFFND